MMNPRLSLVAALCALALATLSGCVPPPKPVGVMDLMEQPAERALLSGMRAYDDAQYAEAEQSLKKALATGLATPRDQATANKLLAFIYCTSNRATECEAAFRAARQADPQFALSKSESGHPLWGPVYRKVAGTP